jgi:5-methylcytosine-specific restriction endonuclease McrA
MVIEYLSKRTHIDIRKKSTNLTTHGAYWLHSASIDHVVPHALGGTNEKDNLVTACPACQFGKGSFSLEELRLTLRPPAADLHKSGRKWSAIVKSLLNNRI